MKKTLAAQRLLHQVVMKSLQQILIALLVTHLVLAAPTSGQNLLERKISLSLNDTSLDKALQKLEKVADVRFSYNSRSLPLKSAVSLHAENEPLSKVLDGLLVPLRISYRQVSNRIVLRNEPAAQYHPEAASSEIPDPAAPAIPPDRTLTGRVADEKGEGLPGVSILLKGTQQGTIADSKGEFSIRVPDEKSVLVFSFVGYLSQEVPVGNRNSIEISLKIDEQALEEVIVVGYGTQKKVNLTGAVSALNEKDFGRRQVGQSSLLLQGAAPGVTVTQRSGQPGRDAGSIRIRGIGTISDANPMVLVDGVEMSMNNIDPGTIESISVLKDASSASIYGSRAANGVILITTKRAKKDQTSIGYSSYYGWDHPTNLPQKVNAVDHMTYHDIAYKNSGRAPIFENLIKQYLDDGGKDRDRFPETDWMDLLLKPGHRQNHLLTFNKGYEKLSLAASFGYFKQDGIVNNTSFERLSFRLNSDLEITSRLKAKFDLMFIHGDRPEPISQNADISTIFFHMYRIPSNQPAIFSNGLYGEGWAGTNPLAWANEGGTSRLRSPQASMNFQFEYKPLNWLTANVVFSPIYTVNHTKDFVRQVTTYNADGTVFVRQPLISTLTETYQRSLNKTLRGTLLAEKNVASHNFKVLGGYSMEDYGSYSFSGYREGFQLPQYDVLDAGGNDNKDSRGTAGEWALSSFFGRINYDFNEKYLLEFTARYDGSSRFSKKNRFALFPSVSAGWRILEERFMQSLNPWFSDLKIRASWGILGNQNIGSSFYPYVSSVPLTVNYTFGNSIASGARLLDLANEELKWEQTEMYNIGLDMELFGKLGITADYFNKRTKDILLRLNIPNSLGLNAPFQNAGVVSNKGWDLGIKYRDHAGRLNYQITAAVSDVVNKIEDLRGISSTALTQNREGFPMNSLFGNVAMGYFRDEADIAESPAQFGLKMYPGDIKYKDIDGNGIINDNDREVFGNTIPRFTYSLNVNLDYRSFDLGVFLQGVGKVDGYLYQSAIMPFYNGGTIYEYHKNYWTPENPDAAFPRLAFDQANNQKLSSFWMRNAAYLRLKNIQLGYSAPSSLTRKIGINTLRVFVTGENLLTIDNFWQGFDVEAPVSTGSYYPQVKTYSIGLNINL